MRGLKEGVEVPLRLGCESPHEPPGDDGRPFLGLMALVVGKVGTGGVFGAALPTVVDDHRMTKASLGSSEKSYSKSRDRDTCHVMSRAPSRPEAGKNCRKFERYERKNARSSANV